jgi:hypothetical protein
LPEEELPDIFVHFISTSAIRCFIVITSFISESLDACAASVEKLALAPPSFDDDQVSSHELAADSGDRVERDTTNLSFISDGLGEAIRQVRKLSERQEIIGTAIQG